MRLINADAFEDDMCNLWMQNEISNGDWIGFREMLNSQETVVEFDGDINKVVVKGVEYFPQKTGKWKLLRKGNDTSDYECTNCLGILMDVANDDNHELQSYCGMCGARMVGEEE